MNDYDERLRSLENRVNFLFLGLLAAVIWLVSR